MLIPSCCSFRTVRAIYPNKQHPCRKTKSRLPAFVSRLPVQATYSSHTLSTRGNAVVLYPASRIDIVDESMSKTLAFKRSEGRKAPPPTTNYQLPTTP